MHAAKDDVTHAAGALQVCPGQEGGGEAVIQAMDELFHCDDVKAVLLVGASNAFNLALIGMGRCIRYSISAHLCPLS